ncbi:hypothetical protein [Falsiroseomonas oryziterrae]|uniref:hypothetical protein n=1 Tax=Falsiroseomonas oryziterrae TaxID=2911368 RepID=UPI001F1F6AF0|nr:hypothetical protein [Roseomonas sp. NPKOSM-4]
MSDFATKLRLTSAVLGCNGHKDLCARFRAVNPDTHFDLERAQKWFQGRSLPRSAGVYDDWAKVLGSTRSGVWLAASSVEAFVAELCALFSVTPRQLQDRLALQGRPGTTAPPDPPALGSRYLAGEYACYSLAWSPYFLGQVIRGALTLDAQRGKSGIFAATYRETLLGRAIEFRGEATAVGRTLHLSLRHAEEGSSPLFMSLLLPGPPASALCGVMSGATLIGPDAQPSATRILVVRVPERADASNRYLAPEPGAVADDLEALGLDLASPAELDALALGFLDSGGAGGPLQVDAAVQARFAAILDRAYLGAA